MDSADRPDTYATRTPGPESIEAMSPAGWEEIEHQARHAGVGLEEFGRGLRESGLLDPGDLEAALAEVPTDPRWSEVEALARSLVRLGKLTRYQAAALYQGKGRALQIGPYVVLDKLGSGGMGMVFRARGRRGRGEVALKLLPPSASRDSRSVLRFRREAAILERLEHPNIVSSHGIGSARGVHYLVMDYVEGNDLDRIVRSGGPMKVLRAVDCVIQAARGLAAAHERGIVHRDIKPANLLLEAGGTVRVLDLGLARITRGEPSGPPLTASGMIMGTVDFLPPEQSDDSKRADHRADIYSLGCTLHYLLTGRPPYSGDSLMERVLAHHRMPIPSLREARPEVPDEVDAVFRAMLAKAPEDRPRSMLEVIEALEAWRGSSVGPRPLRVFDDYGAAPRSASTDSKPEAYDLMTFVRDELFEPDSGATLEAPVLPRKSFAGKKLRRRVGLALRYLVASAAIAVLSRSIPVPPTVPVPAATPVKARPLVVEKAAEPRPDLKAVQTPASSPSPDLANAVEPRTAEPPPPPPLHDRLFGPPHGHRPPPPPGPLGRRRPPPHLGDGPPPRRPGGVPDGGTIPF